MKKKQKKVAIAAGFTACCFVFLKYFGERKKNITDRISFYEKSGKRMVDKGLSFAGLIFLTPIYGLIALAIFLDDPGPVLFTQKRVGKHKEFFMLHKFRSMKMSTPHDVPTHQLENPEQYITRVGKFIRKYSLDELPQIWDIYRGKMSIIGPRPALWNQDDLVAERDKYGVNDILPGLTGWAQINGRDELEIAEKAKLDGEYTKRLKQGGIKALFFDVKCFLGTIGSVLGSEGVVEGGTGKLWERNTEDSIPSFPKKIMIVGAGSYIGEAVQKYLEEIDEEYYKVTVIDAIGLVPQKGLFTGYDAVLNVAGIAHVKETEKNRRLYYEVNRDLAIGLAMSAKEAGVRQFIQLSSMSVYGMVTGKIFKSTVPYPTTAYGESKLAADEAIESLSDDKFRVAILRPPMVYGRGCKGNYQLLRKFALKCPLFPECRNRRSMIFVGNLCEFIKRVIDSGNSGIFFPQNKEYVRTSEMVRLVAKEHRKRIVLLPIPGLLVKAVPSETLRKVFGDLTYEDIDAVGKYNFTDSIRLTEKEFLPNRRNGKKEDRYAG